MLFNGALPGRWQWLARHRHRPPLRGSRSGSTRRIRRARGGDFYLATSGDLTWPTVGTFSWPRTRPREYSSEVQQKRRGGAPSVGPRRAASRTNGGVRGPCAEFGTKRPRVQIRSARRLSARRVSPRPGGSGPRPAETWSGPCCYPHFGRSSAMTQAASCASSGVRVPLGRSFWLRCRESAGNTAARPTQLAKTSRRRAAHSLGWQRRGVPHSDQRGRARDLPPPAQKAAPSCLRWPRPHGSSRAPRPGRGPAWSHSAGGSRHGSAGAVNTSAAAS